MSLPWQMRFFISIIRLIYYQRARNMLTVNDKLTLKMCRDEWINGFNVFYFLFLSSFISRQKGKKLIWFNTKNILPLIIRNIEHKKHKNLRFITQFKKKQVCSLKAIKNFQVLYIVNFKKYILTLENIVCWKASGIVKLLLQSLLYD